MPEPRDLHRGTTGLLSAALVLLGVAIVVRTLAAGGGPLAYGVLVGVLFIIGGALRMWLNTKLARGGGPS